MPPIGKIAAYSAYDMYSWYKYLIVNLVYSHLGFWSGNLFLIAPFPDPCLLVLFYYIPTKKYGVELECRGRVVDSGPRGPGFNPQMGSLSV